MAVTSLQFADEDGFRKQIDRLTHSQTLHNSESLCKLLRYLADHALTQSHVPLKEYQIATEVFGRPSNFDPQADSAIRVQSGRLRSKLVDYYRHEGLTDAIVVEMPKGSYSLQFRYRQLPTAIPISEPAKLPLLVEAPLSSKRPKGWIIAVASLSAVILLALAGVAMLLKALNSARAGNAAELTAPVALRTLWGQFTSGPDAPWIVFSNAAFVGRPETGMRYLDPVHDPHELVLDHYTGVGEVLAVHALDQVFHALNHPILVKRGSLFSLDDAKKNDLIFVGSPAENLSLLDLPGTQEFVFKRLDSSGHKGDLGILNMHPESGQPSIFFPSDSSQPLVEDYAIIALMQGLDPTRHMMILAGTTTIGTQAAVEYVCSQNSVEELLGRLGVEKAADLKPFEALLRVKVTRGVPVGTHLVAVRKRN